jgi:hypothetical protein
MSKKNFNFFLGKGKKDQNMVKWSNMVNMVLMVKKDQIFFHPDMTIFIPIESPRRVDTCYAVFKDT